MVQHKKDAGFTFIELLVAMAVLAIILLPVSSLIIGNFQNIITTGNKSQALFAMQQELENTLNSGTAGEEYPISISFPGVARPLEINGRVITINRNYRRGNEDVITVLKAYVP